MSGGEGGMFHSYFHKNGSKVVSGGSSGMYDK